LNIPSDYCTVDTSAKDKERLINDFNSENPKTLILFITPEVFLTFSWKDIFRTLRLKNKLGLLVFDEVSDIFHSLLIIIIPLITLYLGSFYYSMGM